MKTLIIIASIFVVLTAQAQTRVTKDAQGNYVVAKHDTASQATGKTLTDKDGIVHPVYKSVHGKLYYMRTSKAGNVYKCYLKE